MRLWNHRGYSLSNEICKASVILNEKERFAVNAGREIDDYKTGNKILTNTEINGFVEYNQRKLIKSTK